MVGFQEFDPAGKPFDELYATLEEIREQEPVFFSKKHDGWIISRYDDVMQVVKSPNFTVENALQAAQGGNYCPRAKAVLESGVDWTQTRHIQTDDGPEHGRFRRAIMEVMSPRQMARMEPVVESIVDRLIDDLESRGHCEFVNDFAYPLAMLTTLNLIGFNEAEDDMSRFPVWIDDTFRLLLANLTEEEQVVAARHAVEFQDYIRQKIRLRKANPKDDLLSDILRSLSSGKASLTEDELIIMFTHSFVGAGHETTKLSLTNSIYHLLRDREHWLSLRENTDKVSDYVEECLRYDAPLLAWYRYCQAGETVGGQPIKKGDKVIILFGSANHDADKFEEAESFCPFHKRESRHLTFNAGKHVCPGAPLARLELNTALKKLPERLPGLRLDPGQHVEYVPNFANRFIRRLDLVWTPETAS